MGGWPMRPALPVQGCIHCRPGRLCEYHKASNNPPPAEVMCSWCHTMIAIGSRDWPWCWSCGHRSDVSRRECDCPKCWKPEDSCSEEMLRRITKA